VATMLKETLREKGDLKARTDRSIKMLDQHRARLDKLSPGAKIKDVSAVLGDASGAYNSTSFLIRDIKKAKKESLLVNLGGAMDELSAAARRTRTRFFITDEKLSAMRHASTQLGELTVIMNDYAKLLKLPNSAGNTSRPPTPTVPRGQRVLSGNLDPTILQQKIDKWSGMNTDMTVESDPITIAVDLASLKATINPTHTLRITLTNRTTGGTEVYERVYTLDVNCKVEKRGNGKYAVSGKARGVGRMYANGEMKHEFIIKDPSGIQELWGWYASPQDDGSWTMELWNEQPPLWGEIPYRLQ
jgi:hypothetical protein